jgi:hypothetical protein
MRTSADQHVGAATPGGGVARFSHFLRPARIGGGHRLPRPAQTLPGLQALARVIHADAVKLSTVVA